MIINTITPSVSVYYGESAQDLALMPTTTTIGQGDYPRALASLGSYAIILESDGLKKYKLRSTGWVEVVESGGGGSGNVNIFTGTLDEWNALSPAEKAGYTHLFTTDPINTLAGYGITNAYTKDEVDYLLNTETATDLYEGTISGNGAKLQLTESILSFKRLDICLYYDDSTDLVHVTTVPTVLLISGYGVQPSKNKGVHFFLNTSEPTGTGYMYIPVTGDRTTDFTQIQTQSLHNCYVTITGIN